VAGTENAPGDPRYATMVTFVPMQTLRRAKDGVQTIDLFEVRFGLDDEAIRHSNELAAELRTDTFSTSRADDRGPRRVGSEAARGTCLREGRARTERDVDQSAGDYRPHAPHAIGPMAAAVSEHQSSY